MYQHIKIFIKSIILTVILITISQNSLAQTPSNGIFFQAVARDNFSNPAMNRKIYVQSSIIQTTATGTKVLTEEFQTNTDATGVFSISVGQGARIAGSANDLAGINWANGPYFLSLKIAITPMAPATTWDYKGEWIELGTTSFGAVPYALYAGTAAGLNDKLNINDTSSMLAIYAKANAIKVLETIVGSKIGNTDTAAMLAPYKKIVNELIASKLTLLTADAINEALNSKVSLIDSNTKYVTPTQLAAKTFNISPINNNIATKLNIADSINKYVTPTQLAAKTFDISPIHISIASKVDKIIGKGLSSNDYTNTEKTKLAAITGNNSGDQDLTSYASNSAVNLKLDIADTTAMLNNRIGRDTTMLSNRVNLKLTISDTATMLSSRINRDTTSLSTRINLKANVTDVVNDLALKQAIIATGTTNQFYRGDKTWQTINYATIGAAPTTGSSSITSLGTITSGTWNATTVAVANGGTGATSLAANGVLIGNATSAVTTVTPSTNGNVLTSNGTNWVSSTPSVSLIREVVNEFSASTSQTSFTLTQTPSVNSKVKMYINGVRISNSAYSVSGTTLTYNPTNNGAYSLTASDRIQFDYYY
jgi:hypothetical protein